MKKMLKIAAVSALVGATAMSAGTATAADLGKKNFVVVGTWGFLDHWKEREGPFWNETLPKVSGGALTANAKSQTDLGLSGRPTIEVGERISPHEEPPTLIRSPPEQRSVHPADVALHSVPHSGHRSGLPRRS